jgi:hypothetical protein
MHQKLKKKKEAERDVIVQHICSSQVQAVLLLLGGREINTGVGSAPSSSNPYNKVAAYFCVN